MRKTIYALLALSLFAVFGCSGDTNNTYTTNTGDASIYGPKGKVQGVLRDAVTNLPIANAVIDLGFGSTTTNSNGQFTLVNVPAVADALDPTATATYSGNYTATINLAGTNALIKAANPNDPNVYLYPEVDYRQISVNFTSQNQPSISPFFNNYTTNIVKEELTTTHDFQIGKKSTTVNGVAYYAAGVSGKGLTALPAGSTVNLFTNVASTNSGAGVTRRLLDTTTTGANGVFTFSKVQSNTAVQFDALTADGKYSGARTGIATPNTDGGVLYIDQIAGTVAAKVGIALTALDTQAPIISAVTPETGSDINPATAATVAFTFSEPIAASAYADALTASTTAGLYNDIAVNYNGAKAGNVAHSLAWNGTRTTLTVTIPVLGSSSKYSVDLTAVIASAKLKDVDGNVLTDPNTLKTVSFTTFGGATAAAPSVTVVNSATLDYNSSPVLDWLPTSGAKYYAVYRSMVQNWGATTVVHPYKQLTTTYDSSYTDASVADIAAGTNYPAAQNKKFVENGAIKLTYNYQVKAVNSDNIEGAASTAVGAADAVGSNLNNNGVFVADIIDNNNTITLYFTEPLNKQAAQTVTNYTLSGITPVLTITNAVYNGWDDVNTRSSVTLTLSAVLNPANITRTYISSGTDGILSSTVAGDGALLPPNSGGLCISPQGTGDIPGTVLSSTPNSAATAGLALDDIAFKPADASTVAAQSIYAGADGFCNTTTAVGDTPVVAAGSKPATNGIGITAATYTNGAVNSAAADFALASTLNNIAPATGTADDVIVRTILVTVNPGLTDVAGNPIKTTTTNATTAGNRINSDGSFTLP